MSKEEDLRAEPQPFDQEEQAFARPRALFLLLLVTSFMALAFWALEVRPSLTSDVYRPAPEDVASK